MSDRIGTILTAVANRIQGRGFSVAGVTLPVLQRKAAVRRETLDPPGMITVAKSGIPEEVTRWAFGSKRTDYRIDVVVHGPTAGPDAHPTQHAAVRDQIVDDFSRVPLPGAADVFDISARPGQWLRPLADAGGSQYDWFSCEITASVISPN